MTTKASIRERYGYATCFSAGVSGTYQGLRRYNNINTDKVYDRGHDHTNHETHHMPVTITASRRMMAMAGYRSNV